MKVLALETMGRLGSVAALEEGAVVAERPLDPALRSAQSITPAIGELLEQFEWQPSDLDLITVTTGPGSFTGLRIGVTTAKVLAYAASTEVIGVDALEVIASQTPDDVEQVHVVVGAERQQLFARSYSRSEKGDLAADGALRIIGMDEWLEQRVAGDFVTGSGLTKIVDRLPSEVIVADREDWDARATTVGIVGLRQYEQGQRDDPWKLLPEYGRRSAAEEKADARILGKPQ